MGSIFRKTILISLAGHLAMFGFFSFSFGRRIPLASYPEVYFRGAVLSGYDLISRRMSPAKDIKEAFFKNPDTANIDKKRSDYPPISDYYFKPQVASSFAQEKTIFKPQEQLVFSPKKRESVIMLYPPLPYHFMLYFKDRQAVHIEIGFKVTPVPFLAVNSIEIKRKISSGNLEVDLLSMRYLTPYLFMQQNNFTPGDWHAVKIDLTPQR